MDYLSAAEKVLRLLIISCFIIVQCKVKGEYSTSGNVTSIPQPLTYPVPEQIEMNDEHGGSRTQIGDVEIIEYKNGPIMQKQENEEVEEGDGDGDGDGNSEAADEMPEEEIAEEPASAESSVQPPVSAVTIQPEGVGATETLQNDAPTIEAEAEAAVHQTPPETEKWQNNNTGFKNLDRCYTCDNARNCTWYAAETINCKAEAEFSETKKTHSGCYTMFDAASNGTFRGCVEELTQGGLMYCLTHPQYCKVCFTNNCNHLIIPNATANRRMNGMLLAVVIGFIIIKSISVNSLLPF